MTALTPSVPVGTVTATMVVVICPKCGQARWANICGIGRHKSAHKGNARTTCCGALVPYKETEKEASKPKKKEE